MPGLDPRHTVGAARDHVSKGSHPRPDYLVEEPSIGYDPQSKFGASTQYAADVKAPHTVWNFRLFPWMTIPGPQLRQAASLHNIWNAAPPFKIVFMQNPQVNYKRSNRMASIFSNRIKLPNTGIFSTGGQT